MYRRLLSRAGRAAPAVVMAGVAAASLLRLGVQDRAWPWLSAVYYATPPVLLAILAFAAAGAWIYRRRRRLAIFAAAIGTTWSVWTWHTAWFARAALTDGDASARVLFWNTARGAAGWEDIAGAIWARRPDIVGLVEAGERVPLMRATWAKLLPGYNVHASPYGIALLTRGELTWIERGPLEGRLGCYEHCVVTIDEQPLHVFVVDFHSSPFHSRVPRLERLAELLAPWADQPVLVMGDFNTPLDSRQFDGLRRTFTPAFELAGDGYVATWPWPVPMLAIDHIWANAGVHVQRCHAEASWCSDHRMLIAQIAVRPTPAHGGEPTSAP